MPSRALTGGRVPLTVRDRVIVSFLVFFLIVSVLEAYWLVFHNEMERGTDIFARLLSIYWPADRAYRIPG